MRQIIYSNAGSLSASMICSGWDPYKGYQIYSVNQTGFFQEGDWAMSGSGSTFIWGYFDANYRNDFTLEEAKEFITIVRRLVRQGGHPELLARPPHLASCRRQEQGAAP